MIHSTPADRVAAARVRWSAARLLVGLGLVLAILTGSWALTHLEAESLQVTPIAELAVTDEPSAVPAMTVDGHAAGDAGDFGAVLCLLGVACALVFVVLASRVPARTYHVERVDGIVRELIAVPPSRRPALSLTQLGVSRT